ncbi:MAG: hypothetical protein WC223_10645 [Bacteroidales bacterium]|jgi:hypothetical protein
MGRNVIKEAYYQIASPYEKDRFHTEICNALEIRISSFYNYLYDRTPLSRLQTERLIQIINEKFIYINLKQEPAIQQIKRII